ncbi:transcriptional regulator [Halobacteriales archaeon QS_1_68_20]|nr:MAG: transcriptional regulator [Halobacteriales archaeon QS_1_68_20]
MVRGPFGAEEAPEVQVVLDALHDQDCRTIVNNLDEPMSAQELASTTEIPQSTAYRKLDKLTEATILDERTEIRSDGHHTTRYVVDVEEVRLPLTEDLEFGVEIDRPARTPDERLADMWSEVRRET